MPRFQVHDTVALKKDKTFIGSIERTSHFESEALDDCLIIAHTDVPLHLIEEFVTSGTPPHGYVFVQFASQEKGSSLVSEDDILLIDRALDLGDVVRQAGSQQAGTVVNVSCSYVLSPIWEPSLNNDFAAKATDYNRLTSQALSTASYPDPSIEHPRPRNLIRSVPFEELKRAQDFMEGDYVIQQDWVGLVDSVELLVVVKLSNDSVVVVKEPEELFIPIPDYNKPTISLPEFDGIARPPHVSSLQGWGNAIPPEDLECGQFVVTNHSNLRQGRWLRGSYDASVKPEGRVLMVRCRRLGIQWLMCNAYTPENHWHSKKPDRNMPYENLNNFLEPQEIRRDKKLAIFDPSKPTATIASRTRAAMRKAGNVMDPTTSAPKVENHVNLSSNFGVGQRVKFRDAAGAAVKYQSEETDGVRRGRFNRILHNDTFGYDVNEFEIVHSQQKALVRWQDGRTTEHLSIALDKTNLFEQDYVPGDLVVAREGMRMRRQPSLDEPDDAPNHPTTAFNEMAFFEHPHELIPSKVGVIQHVDPGERVAQIRWFANPTINITSYGNALSGHSRFGPISDEFEDVSLYEVMSFPGLVRKLRDLVTIPPSLPSEKAVRIISEIDQHDLEELRAYVTSLSQMEDRHPNSLLLWMQHVARMTLNAETLQACAKDDYKPHRSLDWVGEISQIRTDGLLVVRVNHDDQGRDVVIEHDQLLSFIDEQVWGIDMNEDPMELDESSSEDEESVESEEALFETVEYEGGKRIDYDPGDENWETDDEGDKIRAQSPNSNVEMPDAHLDTPLNNILAQDADLIGTKVPSQSLGDATSEPSLASFLEEKNPPAFMSLEREPPFDQYRNTWGARSNPQVFLKRIAKEHRILSSSLPKDEIYVRTYDSRLDLLRCLIIGPADTPYEHAPFVVDLHLGPTFPREPPSAHFHSWTSGLGRINPNLYEEGKICLSLLGTWPGKSETEGWSEKATILQLLVSLQGLVFVKAPFYNEAGFEGYETTREYTNESLQYSEKAYVMGRNFVKHALSRPVGGIEDVLAWLYLPRINGHHGAFAALQDDELGLLKEVITRSQALMEKSEELRKSSKQLGGKDDIEDRLLSGVGQSDDQTRVFLRPLSRGAFVMLSKTLKALQGILARELSAMTAIGQSTKLQHDANSGDRITEPEVD